MREQQKRSSRNLALSVSAAELTVRRSRSRLGLLLLTDIPRLVLFPAAAAVAELLMLAGNVASAAELGEANRLFLLAFCFCFLAFLAAALALACSSSATNSSASAALLGWGCVLQQRSLIGQQTRLTSSEKWQTGTVTQSVQYLFTKAAMQAQGSESKPATSTKSVRQHNCLKHVACCTIICAQ